MIDIAVFADIHGNHSALQACIDYAMGEGDNEFPSFGGLRVGLSVSSENDGAYLCFEAIF